ncbi:MAG: hypothetical protein WAN36_10080 [Calditrichia bacterium]
MNSPFLYMASIIMLTRLYFHFRDKPPELRQIIIKTVIELTALLLLSWNRVVFGLAIFILLINVIHFVLIRRSGRKKMYFLRTLFFYLLAFAILFSPPLNAQFNPAVMERISRLMHYTILAEKVRAVQWNTVLLLLSGWLLSLGETNFFIRTFLSGLELVPRQKAAEQVVDRKEYNRGRIIGFLERTLIYVFVLYGNFSAIGLILTAKGITRFRELEERGFAEYFLIGTLLSTVVAGGIALGVGYFLST